MVVKLISLLLLLQDEPVYSCLRIGNYFKLFIRRKMEYADCDDINRISGWLNLKSDREYVHFVFVTVA